MPVYSHSQLSTYEQCPLKYRLSYIDRIKRDVEGVEAFLGTMVHETLQKCYDDARLTKLDTLDELLTYYDNLWQRRWHDAIVITKQDVTPEHYRALGKRMLQTFYQRHAPFDADLTIQTEMRLNFALDAEGKYKLTGFIDRLSRTADGVYCVHDYKTSAHLPAQADADSDRQLALYHVGVQKRWPDIKDVKLVWHYLAFDHELVSSRSEEAIARLTSDTIKLIDEIEATEEFQPRETGLCQWCEYPDLCPTRKHFHMVEALPANEYLAEPGVALVNKYAELRDQSAAIDEEMGKVREAIIAYAQAQGVSAIKGSGHQARVKLSQKLKFPGKNDADREALDGAIVGAGKWMEVSQLDTTALAKAVESGAWDRRLIDRVMKYGKLEETAMVSLARLKDREK